MTRFLLIALFLPVSVLAQQPRVIDCGILQANEHSLTAVEVVFDCDLHNENTTDGTFSVTSTGHTITATPVARTRVQAQFFTGVMLLLDEPMREGTYTVHADGIVSRFQVNAEQFEARVSGKEGEVRRKGGVRLNRFDPYQLFATFPAAVTPDATVTIKRAGTTITPKVHVEQRVPTALLLTIDQPLLHGDALTVTATTTAGAQVTAVPADGKVAFAKPADRKAAAVYLGLSTDAGQYQKPNIQFDLKAEYRMTRAGYTTAPRIDVLVATQDANATNRAVVGWNWEKMQLIRRGALLGIFWSVTPSAELEKGLVNRNGVLDVTGTLVLPSTTHFTFRPTFGAEVGRNFGLKKDYRQFEDYDIRRLKANTYLGWAWDLPPRVIPGVQRVSFSVDATARHLLTEEVDSTVIPPRDRTDPKVTATYSASGETRFYGTATLGLTIADYTAFAIEYTRGERPLLYEDNNKVSIKLTFSF
jgi:hypothetical protein